MAEIKDPENTIIIELKDGNVVIELLPDVAPEHSQRMKDLARAGEYDNVAFHRVIDGFMAQTGDVQHGDMEDGFNIRMAGTGGSSMADLPADRCLLIRRRENPELPSLQCHRNRLAGLAGQQGGRRQQQQQLHPYGNTAGL